MLARSDVLSKKKARRKGRAFPYFLKDQTTPKASMASATFLNPAMFAPRT